MVAADAAKKRMETMHKADRGVRLGDLMYADENGAQRIRDPQDPIVVALGPGAIRLAAEAIEDLALPAQVALQRRLGTR